MNASWPVVFGALVAGAIGGFMVPVRPEIRDVPALTKRAEPAKSAKAETATPSAEQASAARSLPRAEKTQDIRKIPLTETAAKDSANAKEAGTAPSAPAPTSAADAKSCSTETWPYRSPGCLDRSAAVANADVVVNAKRVDPVVNLRDATEPKARASAETQPNSKAKQKVVSAPEQQPAEKPKPDPAPAAEKPEQPDVQQASANAENESQEVTAAPEKPAARAEELPRPSRRYNASRTRTNLDDGIPTRVYLRGPDGRLYLAPQYRFNGPPRYYAR